MLENKAWPTKKLGEVVIINYGKGLSKSERTEDGTYWAYGSNGPVYQTNKFLVNKPTIIIGRKGATGAVHLVENPCWPIDTTFYVGIKKERELELTFLFYLLQTLQLKNLAIVTAVPGINRDELYNLKIPLPPLEIQREIVEWLDAIRKAQELNDKQIALADELFQSLLHRELDPKGKNWEVKRLGEVCEKIQQIHPKKLFDEKFRYIDIESVDSKTNTITADRWISVDEAPSRARKPVKAGDTIFATTRPYLKNIAYIDSKFDNSVASTGFCIIRAKSNLAEPKFLFFQSLSKPFVSKVLIYQRGASYPAVSDSNIYNLKIPVPPLSIQRQIVKKLQAVQNYKKSLLAQKQKLQELFESTLDKLMKGELVR